MQLSMPFLTKNDGQTQGSGSNPMQLPCPSLFFCGSFRM